MALGWPGTLVSLQCRDLPVGKRLRKRTKERGTEKGERPCSEGGKREKGS